MVFFIYSVCQSDRKPYIVHFWLCYAVHCAEKLLVNGSVLAERVG